MTDVHRCMVVTAAQVAAARRLGGNLSPAGAGMFTAALRPVGSTGPATHYVSAGFIAERFADAIVSADLLYAAAQACGDPATAAVCAAIVDSSDVSADDPHAVFARLGLELISE